MVCYTSIHILITSYYITPNYLNLKKGSFKIRGVLNQVEQFNKSSDKTKLVTFSAGNYGKAFSYICSLMKLKGKVLLPETAPESRIKFIQVKDSRLSIFR